MACLPHPGQPETQQLSRWLKDFFLPHNPVKGQQRGQFSVFLVSQAWSPLGPVRMCPPAAVGDRGCSLVPREAWRKEVCALLVGLTHGS